MNKGYISLFIFCISLLLLNHVDPLEAYDESSSGFDNTAYILKDLSYVYPGIMLNDPDIDTEWEPAISTSILWVCSKKHHLFLGIDRPNGVVFLISSVAVGRNTGQKKKVGDMRTPEGKFTLSMIQDASWWKPYEDKQTGERIGYGPFFLRLDTGKWKGIGIHGTDEGHIAEIGTNASHGCLRLKNKDLVRVVDYSMVGQEVVILP